MNRLKKITSVALIALLTTTYVLHADVSAQKNSTNATGICKESNTSSASLITGQMLRSTGTTLLFLGLLLAASYFVRKRAGKAGFGQTQHIKIIERTALNNRHSVILLEIDGQRYLAGLAPQSMTIVSAISSMGNVPKNAP